MHSLNLRQLEVFCAVAEQGGFTAAAEALFLAQSSVSGHVAALEKELGAPLLLRTGRRGVTLTEEGRRVYALAKTILQSCGELSGAPEGDAPELRLAASSIPMQYILPPLLARFAAAVPGCRFTVLGGDSETVHRTVLEGGAQLGFAGAALDPRELRYDLLAEDALVLIAPNTRRFAALRREGATGNALLSTEPLILREAGSGTQRAVDAFLEENDLPVQRLHPVARIADNGAVVRAVAAGLGCAVLSGLAAAAAPDVLAFPLTGVGARRRLYMLRRRDGRPSPATRRFMDFVLEGAGETASPADVSDYPMDNSALSD